MAVPRSQPADDQYGFPCFAEPFAGRQADRRTVAYDRDPCAFWSILDQVQERMATSDWSNVRDDGRFIQSFITKSEPHLPLVLSPFLAAVTDALIHHTDVAAAVAAHSRPNSVPDPSS